MFLITKQFGGSTRAEGSRDPAVGGVASLECARVDVAIAHDMSVSPGRTAESAEAIDWPHRARAHPLAVADAVKALTRAFLQWQIRACALISLMAAAPRLRSHQPSLPTQGFTAGMRVLGHAISNRCFRFWNAVSSGEAQGNCH
jgi:hypothetical protein